MAQTFKPEEMPDAERARRAAEWIETGIQDFKRALELVARGGAEPHVRDLIGDAEHLADAIRKKPDQATTILSTPKE